MDWCVGQTYVSDREVKIFNELWLLNSVELSHIYGFSACVSQFIWSCCTLDLSLLLMNTISWKQSAMWMEKTNSSLHLEEIAQLVCPIDAGREAGQVIIKPLIVFSSSENILIWQYAMNHIQISIHFIKLL